MDDAMRRLAWLLVAVILLCTHGGGDIYFGGKALGQILSPILNDQNHASGAAYSGPCDVVSSPIAWWGLRACSGTQASAGATTTKVLDVAGSSTGSCTIFLKGDGTGNLDFSTAGAGGIGNQCLLGATTFCTVTNTSCLALKLYDLSGATNCGVLTVACPLTQGTTALQPTLTFNCLNTTLPCLTFVRASNQTLVNSNSVASVVPVWTVSFVAERTGSLTSFNDVYTTAGVQIGFNNANSGQFFAGNVVNITGVADNAFHAIQAIDNNASSIFYVDGTSNGSLNTGNSTQQTNYTIGSNGGGNSLDGKWTELGIWGSGFTAPNQSAMNSNQHTYWGF
jgi:hypothetical protein